MQRARKTGAASFNLERAQALLTAYDALGRVDDLLDEDVRMARALVSDAFFRLTKRPAFSVSATELSTVNPAPWTKEPAR